MAEGGYTNSLGEVFNDKYIFIGPLEVFGELKAFSQQDDIHILKQICDFPGFEQFAIKWPHRDLDHPNFEWVEGPVVGRLKSKENMLFAAICDQVPGIELYVRALSLPYKDHHQLRFRQRVAVLVHVTERHHLESLRSLLLKQTYFFQILEESPWYIK